MSLKTVHFSSGSSELCSSASKPLQISLINACLLLSCFSLETLWHFLALWSPCRLNAQVEFGDMPEICSTVFTTHSLSHSDILPVLPLHCDIVSEMPMFGARGASMMFCCELVDGRLSW